MFIQFKKSAVVFLVFLVGVSLLAQVPQSFNLAKDPSKAGFDKARLTRIDSVLQSYIDRKMLPNAVTFVARQGKIVHYKAFGYRNIEKQIPVRTDDIFRNASQTKAVVSVALMTLYEEGRFLLDDPISKYIPEFKNTPVLDSFIKADTTYITRPAKRQITIRHLLSHTAGIHYGILGGGIGGMMYAKEGIPAVNSLDPITLEQVVKKIAKMPLMFDPGDKFMYGMNIDVIGYLIEVLSGQPLDVFVTERVLKPLGMNDSYFYLPDSKANRLVTLYSYQNDSLFVSTNKSYQYYPISGAKTFLCGGAGLCGPIEDYARFCQMLLNKGTFNQHRILSPKTVELMTMNQIGDLSINQSGDKFGLGFQLFSDKTCASYLCSKGSYRWGGMYNTDYLIDPSNDLIFLIYTNVNPYRGENFNERYHNLVYQAVK